MIAAIDHVAGGRCPERCRRDAPKNTVVFERIFKMPRVIDAARIAEVKALPAGEKLTLDTDGDGDVDEAWYIATDYRHNKDTILVCAVDEDGDYAKTGRPDLG